MFYDGIKQEKIDEWRLENEPEIISIHETNDLVFFGMSDCYVKVVMNDNLEQTLMIITTQ